MSTPDLVGRIDERLSVLREEEQRLRAARQALRPTVSRRPPVKLCSSRLLAGPAVERARALRFAELDAHFEAKRELTRVA